MNAGDANPDIKSGTRATAIDSRTRRHSTAVVIGATMAGMVLGAMAAFAITGLVWTVRVELPPPLYPSSTPTVSYPPLPPGTAT
ncbi:hypothetical protein, partial [Mycobacterium basiliense]